MSQLTHLWVAMLTDDSRYADTDSKTVLIINEDGVDRLHHTFEDTPQPDQEEGQANLYEIDVEGKYINPYNLNNSSVRVGIRGGDQWRPQHYVVWGQRSFSVGYDQRTEVLPIAMETNLDVKLSTTSYKGAISFPLRRVHLGDKDMQIERLLLLMTTADVRHADTDDDIRLRITNGDGDTVVDFTITGEEPQAGLRAVAAATFYLVPVIENFTYDDFYTGSIELSIGGRDAWLPESIFLFGLDTELGRPNYLVPLVHYKRWTKKWLSTDTDPDGDNGVAFVSLPKYVY